MFFNPLIPEITSPDDPNAYLVGALVLIATMLTAGLVYLVKTYKQAQGANDNATAANNAVNNIGPNDIPLRQLVLSIGNDVSSIKEVHEEQARRGWMSLPDDISTGSGLTQVIRSLQAAEHASTAKVDAVEKRVLDMKQLLTNHIQKQREQETQRLHEQEMETERNKHRLRFKK